MEPRQAILVVSFGTSYNDSREKTIGAVERAVAEAFPAYEVRRAFTSQRIIDKLKKRDQRSIDNLKEALIGIGDTLCWVTACRCAVLLIIV